MSTPGKAATNCKFRFTFSLEEPEASTLTTMVPIRGNVAADKTISELCQEFEARASKRYASLASHAVDSLVCSDPENGGSFTLDLEMNGDDTLDCYWPLDSASIHDVVVKWKSSRGRSKEPSPAPVVTGTDEDQTRRYIPTKPPARAESADDNDGRNGGRPSRHRPASLNRSQPGTPTADSNTVIMTFPTSPPLRNTTPSSDDEDDEQSPRSWLRRQLSLLRETEEEDRMAIVVEEGTEFKMLIGAAERNRVVSKQHENDRLFSHPRTPSSSPQGALTGASHRGHFHRAVIPQKNVVVEVVDIETSLRNVESDWTSVRYSILTEERKTWRKFCQDAKLELDRDRDNLKRAVDTPPMKLPDTLPPRAPVANRAPEKSVVVPPVQTRNAAVTSQPPPPPPPPDLSPELVMAIQSLTYLESSDRESTLLEPERNEWSKIFEEHWLVLKREQLRRENEDIKKEKDLVRDEMEAREQLEQQQARKFQLFVSLCQKGIARLSGK